MEIPYQRARSSPPAWPWEVKSVRCTCLTRTDGHAVNMTKHLDVEGWHGGRGNLPGVAGHSGRRRGQARVRSYCWNSSQDPLQRCFYLSKAYDLGTKCRHLVEEIFVVVSWTLTHHRAFLLPDGSPSPPRLPTCSCASPLLRALAAAVGLQWTLWFAEPSAVPRVPDGSVPARDLQDVGRILDMGYESAGFVELRWWLRAPPPRPTFQFASTFRDIDNSSRDDIEPSDTATISPQAAMTSLDQIQWK